MTALVYHIHCVQITLATFFICMYNSFFSLWLYYSDYWVSECIINLRGTGRTGAISSVRHQVNFSPSKCPTSPRTIPVLLYQLHIYCVNVFIYCFIHLHLCTIPFISSIDVSKEIYEIVSLYPISCSTFYWDVLFVTF